MSRDIFISYSHADQTIANKVCQRLEEAGFSCWISSRDELPGEQWAEMIARGVDESKIVLFILSNHSNNSPACVKELALAHDKDKIIIPLRVEEVILSQKLEFFLVGQQRIDALTAPIEKHLSKLIDALSQLTKRPPPKDTRPPPLPRSRKKKYLTYGAVCVAVLILIAVAIFIIFPPPQPPDPQLVTFVNYEKASIGQNGPITAWNVSWPAQNSVTINGAYNSNNGTTWNFMVTATKFDSIADATAYLNDHIAGYTLNPTTPNPAGPLGQASGISVPTAYGEYTQSTGSANSGNQVQYKIYQWGNWISIRQDQQVLT